MRSSKNFILIDEQLVFIDDNYTAVTTKNLDTKGKYINIADLDKGQLAYRLYKNLSVGRYIDPLETIEFIFRFKENGQKINSYKWKDLYIDLSKDIFDPTDYDRKNATYLRNDVLTAYQCVEQMNKEVEYSRRIKVEVTHALQNFLDRTDFKVSTVHDNFELYFKPELPFEQLTKIADLFKAMDLQSYAKPAKTYKIPPQPCCIEIRDSYQKIIQNLDKPELEAAEQTNTAVRISL